MFEFRNKADVSCVNLVLDLFKPLKWHLFLLLWRLYHKPHNSAPVFSNWRRWDRGCQGSDAPAGHLQTGSWNALSRELTRQVHSGLICFKEMQAVTPQTLKKSILSGNEGVWLWNCVALELCGSSSRGCICFNVLGMALRFFPSKPESHELQRPVQVAQILFLLI